jgi:hypothetical protein
VFTAASAERDRFPALFQLALQIISEERELPDELSDHLKRVIQQAIQIYYDPAVISAQTMPDAIQLALDFKRSKRIREAIAANADAPVSSNTAKSILALERKFASAR